MENLTAKLSLERLLMALSIGCKSIGGGSISITLLPIHH